MIQGQSIIRDQLTEVSFPPVSQPDICETVVQLPMQCTALLSSIVFNFSYAEVLFLDCGFVVCWGLEFLLFVLTACCVIKVASGSY